MAGISFCGNCGNPITPSQTKCSRCGTPGDPNIGAQSLENSSTICLSCGHSRLPNQIKCPNCNSKAPTILAGNFLDLPTLPANIPTPPFIVQKPTEVKRLQALISQKNPYALWGTLVLDDNLKMKWKWDKLGLRRSFSQWLRAWAAAGSGNNETTDFVVDVVNGMAFLEPPIQFSNFAFQVQIVHYVGECGIIFRSNSEHTSYYFCKFYYGQHPLAYCYELRVISKRDEAFITKGSVLYSETGEDGLPLSELVKATHLIGIVAQGNTIDLYIDLRHLKRVYDNTFSSGEIGIYVRGKPTWYMTYRSAKLWTP